MNLIYRLEDKVTQQQNNKRLKEMSLEELFDFERSVITDAIQNGVYEKTRDYIDKCKSCKTYIGREDKYLNCMIQKFNSVYEDVIAPKIKQRYLK